MRNISIRIVALSALASLCAGVGTNQCRRLLARARKTTGRGACRRKAERHIGRIHGGRIARRPVAARGVDDGTCRSR
jgi:hypothetical protein